MQEANLYRPYLIATVILIAALYCGLIVWIALRPVEILDHEDKAFALLLLVLLPGKYVLEWIFEKYGLHAKLQKRLSGMAFVGLLIGLLHATEASGILSAATTFLVFFVIASLVFLLMDVVADWVWVRWKSR